MIERSEYLDFSLDLARAAEREILGRFQTASVEHKPDGSEVTEADRRAEEVMRALIAEKFPGHGILGEEGGEHAGEGRHQWLLDPIDGTAWFALGIAKFGTMIGLLDRGHPVLGVIHLPVTGETLYAETGNGCWYRRGELAPERVRVDSSVKAVEDAFISAAGVHRTEIVPDGHPNPISLAPALSRARRVRFVGDCVQHLLVARGRLHAAIDPMVHPWDVAAIIPCIREAGGVVSTVRGETDNLTFRDSLLSSCSPELHEALIDLFGGG